MRKKQAARLATDLIKNRTLVFTLKQQADELDALKKLSLNLTSSLDLQTVLDAVVTEAMRLVKNARSAHIFLYTNKKLEFGAALNDEGVRNVPLALPRPNGLTYNCRPERETGSSSKTCKNTRSMRIRPADWAGFDHRYPAEDQRQHSGCHEPVKINTRRFSSSELRLLELLSDQAAVAISNASLHQIISRQAYSDTVTGLPNRWALDQRLDQEVLNARRTGNSFAVIMMDLDGFKTVNDTHGHVVGDQVLRTIFNYMATGLRATDFLARYGGDELTLIMSRTDPASSRIVVEKILEKVDNFSYRSARR